MSLLTSTNAGSASNAYFIENIGGSGDGADIVPCIKAGDALGLIRIGNPTTGLIAGATLAGTARVRGGGPTSAGGSTLALGASEASFQNIVLTDGITTVNGTLSVPAGGDIFVGDNIELGGTLVFTNGATGESISGYYTQTVGPLNCPDGVDTVVPQPAGQTPGWYIIAASTAPGGQAQQQVSTLAYWTGVIYLLGGCNGNDAGAGRVAFNLNVAHNGIVYSNSTGAPQNGVSVAFTKLMN